MTVVYMRYLLDQLGEVRQAVVGFGLEEVGEVVLADRVCESFGELGWLVGDVLEDGEDEGEVVLRR